MVKWLGQVEYDALEKRARSYKNRGEAILDWMKLWKTLN